MPGSAQGIRAGRAFIELFADDAALQKGLRAAEAKLKAFGSAISGVGVQVGAAGAAMTAGFLGAAKLFADSGSELADMSARTGLSVEALSQLSHAATQTGTDLATTEAGVRKMQKTLFAAATGSNEAAVSFASLGLSVDSLLKLSPDKQFQAVAKAIAAIPNPTAKAATAMAILGKSGTALLPLIDDFDALTKEARDLGLVMSTEDANAADALGDAMDIVLKVMKQSVIVLGSAVAPLFTEIAGVITKIAKSALDWAAANKPLIQTIFLVGAGIAAAGAALIAFGAAVSLAGVALGGVATAIGIVGAALGALLSPIGLVAAGLVVGIAAFLKYTTTGQQMVASLVEGFQSLLADATSVFNGIADALKAGDLALAGKILWAGLQLEWIKGTNAVLGIWRDYRDAVLNIWSGVGVSIAKALDSAWANIKKSFGAVVDYFKDAWSGVKLMFSDTAAEITAIFKKIVAVAKNPFGGAELEKELQRIDKEKASAQDANSASIGKEVGGRSAARTASDKEIDAARAKEAENLDAGLKATKDEREAANKAAMDAAMAQLKAAQENLDNLKSEAASKAVKATASPSAKKGGEAPEIDVAGIADGIEAAAKKVDVTGSFNAAAFRGLGIGDSVAGNQLKEQKKTTEQLEKLNRKASDRGLVIRGG